MPSPGALSNWQLMVLLLKLLLDPETLLRYRDFAPELKARIIEVAKREGVAEALAYRLYGSGAVTSDNSRDSELLQILRQSTVRNMAYVSQTVKLARALNGVGITPVLLKGSAYLLSHYKDRLGCRQQGDIDLLVAPAEIHAACEALTEMGYRFVEADSGFCADADEDLSVRDADSLSRHHHHFLPLIKVGEPAAVEVHRHHLPRRFQARNPVSEVIDNAVTAEYQGAVFKIPSAEHLLIHLILGKLVHDGELARKRLPVRDIVDYVAIREGRCDVLDEALIVTRCRNVHQWLEETLNTVLSINPLDPRADRQQGQGLWLMKARYDSAGVATIIDSYARAAHLSESLIHNPAKLGGYLRRTFVRD